MKPFAIETIGPDAESAQVMEVKITGYLDAHTVDAFERAIEEMLAPPSDSLYPGPGGAYLYLLGRDRGADGFFCSNCAAAMAIWSFCSRPRKFTKFSICLDLPRFSRLPRTAKPPVKHWAAELP